MQRYRRVPPVTPEPGFAGRGGRSTGGRGRGAGRATAVGLGARGVWARVVPCVACSVAGGELRLVDGFDRAATTGGGDWPAVVTAGAVALEGAVPVRGRAGADGAAGAAGRRCVAV